MEDRILINKPRITTVKQVRTETNDILTLFVQDKRCSAASPGQFAMIWVPGIGEIPMSLSFMDGNNTCGFTVKSIGITTKALCNKKKNDTIGIRGLTELVSHRNLVIVYLLVVELDYLHYCH